LSWVAGASDCSPPITRLTAMKKAIVRCSARVEDPYLFFEIMQLTVIQSWPVRYPRQPVRVKRREGAELW